MAGFLKLEDQRVGNISEPCSCFNRRRYRIAEVGCAGMEGARESCVTRLLAANDHFTCSSHHLSS